MVNILKAKKPKSLVISFFLPLVFNVFGLLYINKASFIAGATALILFLLFGPKELALLLFGASSLIFAVYSIIAANYSNNKNAFTSELDSKSNGKTILLVYQIIILGLSILAMLFMFGLIVIAHPLLPAFFLVLHIVNIYFSNREGFKRMGSNFAIVTFSLGLYLAIKFGKYVLDYYNTSDFGTGESFLIILGIFAFIGLFILHIILLFIDVFFNSKQLGGSAAPRRRKRKSGQTRPRSGRPRSSPARGTHDDLKEMLAQIQPFAKKGHQLCIDTNIAMNPTSREALRQLFEQNYTVYISEKVIDELDHHKTSENQEVKSKSRAATNLFIRYKTYAREYPRPAVKYIQDLRLNPRNPDDIIIATYCQLLKNGPVLFITGDGNPILRAERAGLDTVRLKSI